MKTMKKKLLAMLAVVMLAASACAASVYAEVETLLFADFTDTEAETLPLHNTDATNDGGRMKKATDIF